MEKRDWTKLKEFEAEYTRKKYAKLTSLEKLKISEDLYSHALKIAPDKVLYPWPGDENWNRIPHLRHLIETRRKLLKLVKTAG